MIFTYKRFTYYVMILTTILFAVYSYFILNYKMLYMNYEYPAWMDVYDRMHTKADEQYNVIAFGDSRTKSSFLPHEFDDDKLNSLNLALGGSTPIEGYYTFVNYLKHNEKPEMLVLGYTPGLLTTPYYYLANTVKFRFLEDENYEEIEDVAESLHDNQIIGAIDHEDYTIYTGKYLTDLLNGIENKRWITNAMSAEYLQNSKGHQYAAYQEGSWEMSTEIKQGAFRASPLIREYFERILTLAAEKDIKVYWYTNPINTPSLEALPEAYKSAYDTYLDDLANEYGLIILTKHYAMAPENFGDADHIYRGGPLVTADIKKRIHESTVSN